MFLLVVSLQATTMFSQTPIVDSLNQIIRSSQVDSIKGEAYIDLAEYFRRRDSELAIKYLDSAKVDQSFLGNTSKKAATLYLRANILSTQNNTDSALYFLKLAEELSTENSKMMFLIVFSRGNIALRQADYDLAYQNYTKAMQLAIEEDNEKGVADAHNNLGIVQKKLENFDLARTHYEDALTIYQRLNLPSLLSTCILNIANIDSNDGQFKAAVEGYETALKIEQKQEKVNDRAVAYIYNNLSSCFHKQKDHTKAIHYAELAFEIRKKNSTPRELANSLIGMGTVYQDADRLEESINYLKEAYDKSTGFLEQQDRAARSLTNAYRRLDNFKDALYWFGKSTQAKDSMFHIEMSKQIAKINAAFELEQKESKIVQLELEEELNESKIKKQQSVLLFSVLGICILGYLLWRMGKQKKQIRVQNKKISSSLNDKETLLKEIHHRVKNNLQVISSLLSLQGRHSNDPLIENAIREGRNRVKSMSLIHQNLYQRENFTGIEMDEYFLKLTKSLFDSYNISPNLIKLESDIEHLNLDVDTVVPLGLITNELISNTLKHAFGPDNKGIVKISLKEQDGALTLIVQDNGKGMDNDQKLKSLSSLGYKLIEAFRVKLNAEMLVSSGKEEGTTVTMLIKNYKLVG